MRVLWILTLAFLFSSCSVYKTDFDCKAKTGLGCKSISKIHKMIENDEVKEDERTGEWVPNNDKKVNQKNNVRIWFAPFTDPKGNTHEAKYIKISDE